MIIAVGIIIAGLSGAYATLKSDVNRANKDTTELKDTKLDKEIFTEFKLRQEKELGEFKIAQKEIKDELTEIKIGNARIEEQLKQILKAVNK